MTDRFHGSERIEESRIADGSTGCNDAQPDPDDRE